MNGGLLVVTPTLGQSPFLDRTVEGILALPVPFVHVMVCPAPVVATLAGRFPHAIVIPDAGREAGLYGAINAALETAGEDWSWFTYINDDDELGPDFGQMARRHFAAPNPEPVVYGRVRLIDEQNGTVGFVTLERRPARIPAVLRAGISPLNQQGMLFHRDVVRELRRFDTRYRICADLDFWARALAARHAFRYYPEEVGRFRIRRGQISGDVNLTSREQDEIARRLFPEAGGALNRFMAKWRYRWCNLPYYLARTRTFGWVSSYQILSQGGPAGIIVRVLILNDYAFISGGASQVSISSARGLAARGCADHLFHVGRAETTRRAWKWRDCAWSVSAIKRSGRIRIVFARSRKASGIVTRGEPWIANWPPTIPRTPSCTSICGRKRSRRRCCIWRSGGGSRS